MFVSFFAIVSSIPPRPLLRPEFLPSIPANDNGFACTMCTELVRMVELYLKDGKTQDEIAQLVDKSVCKLLPETYVPLCSQLVNQYLPIIISWAEQKVESFDICKRIGICTEATSIKIRVPKEAYNSFVCDTCKQLVDYVKELLESETAQAKIIELCQQLCDKVPEPYGSVCDQLVAMYIPTIIHWIEEKIESFDICARLGLCSVNKGKSIRKLSAPANDNGFMCTICTELVRMIEDYIDDGKTQEEIAVLLKVVCDKIPAPYGAICTTLVDQYLPVLIQWVEQEIEAFHICTRIGLCTEEQRQSRIRIPQNADNSFVCDICKKLVTYVEQLLLEKYTQATIIALCKQLCDKIPAPYGAVCDALAAQYVPIIIQWLEQKIETIEICRRIGLCSVAAPRSAVRFQVPQNDNGFMCILCKELIRMVEIYIKDGKTEQEIVDLLEKLCQKTPAPYTAICSQLVNQYLHAIIEWLEQKIEAFEICQRIGICTEEQRTRPIRVPASGAEDGFTCDICKQLVAYVEQLLLEKMAKEKIIELCQELCDKIPSPYGAICDALVAQYVPQIIQWIEQKVEVLQICSKIGLCAQKRSERKAVISSGNRVGRLPSLAQRAAQNGISCDLCKDFIKWTEQMIDKYTVPALWKLISVDCMKVKYISSFCKIITESDIETILNLILSKLPPDQVCQWIKICK